MRIRKLLLPLASLAAISSLSLSSCQKDSNTNEVVTNDDDDSTKGTLTTLSVNSANAQKKFSIGEAFNAKDLQVTAFYSNKKVSTLTSDQYVVDSSEFNSNVAGTYVIHVNYIEGTIKKSDAYEVVVESIAKKQAVYLKGISVTGVKLNYKPDESETVIDDNLVAVAHYSDNSEKDVTDKIKKDYNFNGHMVGTYVLKYTYSEDYTSDGKTETKTSTTFDIATVDSSPIKLRFESGSRTVEQNTVGPDGKLTSLDVSDWKVMCTFTDVDNFALDYEVELDPNKLEIKNFNSAKAGEQEIIISYSHPGAIKAVECKTTINVTAVRNPDYQFISSELKRIAETDTDVQLTGETQLDTEGVLFGTTKCQIKKDSGKSFGVWTADDFSKRLQTNGAGKVSQNSIKFVLKEKAVVGIVASDGDKGATNIGFYDSNGKAQTQLLDSLVKNQPSYYKFELEAGTYYFYGTAAIRLYAVQIWYGSTK